MSSVSVDGTVDAALKHSLVGSDVICSERGSAGRKESRVYITSAERRRIDSGKEIAVARDLKGLRRHV